MKVHVYVLHPIVVHFFVREGNKRLIVSEEGDGCEILAEVFPKSYEQYALG